MSLTYDPKNENVINVTLGGYEIPHVWRLDRTSQTWENLGAGLPDVWASDLLVDPKDSQSLYVATDEGVYFSANGGHAWTKWSEVPYPGVMSMQLLLFEHDRLLRLVTHGNGVWQRKLK